MHTEVSRLSQNEETFVRVLHGRASPALHSSMDGSKALVEHEANVRPEAKIIVDIP